MVTTCPRPHSGTTRGLGRWTVRMGCWAAQPEERAMTASTTITPTLQGSVTLSTITYLLIAIKLCCNFRLKKSPPPPQPIFGAPSSVHFQPVLQFFYWRLSALVLVLKITTTQYAYFLIQEVKASLIGMIKCLPNLNNILNEYECMCSIE